MDATELYTYKHLGVYLVFPAPDRGYRSTFGATLVQKIPELPGKFNDWLTRTRRRMDHLLEKVKDPGFTACFELSRKPPVNSGKIKHVYTIDLDRLAFSVDNGAHFRLDSIPRGVQGDEWLRYLGQDGTGHHCLKPSTPRRIIAELQPQTTDLDTIMENTRKYHSLRAKLVSPRDLTCNATRPEFARQEISVILLETLTGQYYGTLCNACQCEPSDAQFQRCAQWLLRAAAPGFLQLDLDGENPVEPEPNLSSRSAIERTNGHQQGVFFTFRGCLVLLSARLDSDMHLRASVVRVVSRVRNKGIRVDVAIIWSIKHVVIVRISDDGIMHTPALPVLAAYGASDLAFTEGVRLLASCLHPSCSLPGRDKSTTAQGDVATSRERTIRGYWQGREAPIDNSRPSIPTDVILEIMKFVDVETCSDVFSRLTQATRAVWMKSTRIGPYTVCDVAPKWHETTCFDVDLDCKARECHFSAYDGTGHPVELSLVYEGHTSLGIQAQSILRARREACKREKLCIRWPQSVDEKSCESLHGIEGRLEVRSCGLYTTVV